MSNTEFERINERLRAIESNLKRVLEHNAIAWAEPRPTDDIPPEVVELARSGNRIEATKLYRELTGAGLGEASEIVGKITH